jgi:hypothetical protein
VGEVVIAGEEDGQQLLAFVEAEQLKRTIVWNLVCDHLKQVLASIRPPPAQHLLRIHAYGIG